jgi:hypothetical protein
MSQQFGSNSMGEYGVFRPDRDADELVLELEAGELRIRRAL